MMIKNEWAMYSFFGFCALFVYLGMVLGTNIHFLYLFLLLPGAVCGCLGYLAYKRRQTEKLLTKLRNSWGKEQPQKIRDFSQISQLYANLARKPTDIDERTWEDLDLDTVFSKIDRTLTLPGQQRLYAMLRTPETVNLSNLKGRVRMINAFQADCLQRENIQMELASMDPTLGESLVMLLWTGVDAKPPHPLRLYDLMSLLALLAPLLLIWGAKYLQVVMLLFFANMYLHFKVHKQIRVYFYGVRSLGQLIAVGRKINLLSCPDFPEVFQLIKSALQDVEKYPRIVRSVGVETMDPFFHLFEQYLSIFLLAEVRGFYRALKFVDQHRSSLQTLFLAIGELDALQSVGSYRDSLDYYCEPEFSERRFLHLVDAYHPLITEPVANSIITADKGILVTGSNMSGKSTFLRTVGLNALFAQTIVTCLAREYTACFVQLLTGIGRADNVVEGKSYYLEEALGVKRVLDALNGGLVTLAIFDELFRGTNSEERIFATQRVLEYIANGNSLVLVATHDLELAEILEQSYTSVHFSERVGTVGLEFDYKLKKGPATSKNAIALLRYLGYPSEITQP